MSERGKVSSSTRLISFRGYWGETRETRELIGTIEVTPSNTGETLGTLGATLGALGVILGILGRH